MNPYLSMADLLPMIAAIFFLILEFVRPNQSYPSDRRWYVRTVILLFGGVLLTTLVGLLVGEAFHRQGFFPPFSAIWQDLPPLLNGLIGYFCVTFINYWWHRMRHQSDFLWRVFHQLHHSTQRIEAAAAFYSHPLDYFSTVVIINFVAYGILGFSVESAAFATAWVGVFEIWEHTNIRTPRWLGYWIVRPEMHRIHHELNKHQNNFGLPLWDMLFGTYENSLRQVECGFSRQRELRLMDMLLLRDVHKR